MRNTFSPTSMPVSLPVTGNASVGTSAHELPTYHPSASRETVTVLGVPWSGRWRRRWSRLGIDTPDLRPVQHPAVQRRTAVLTHLRIGNRGGASRALEARVARVLTGRDATEEGGNSRSTTVQHVLPD